MKTVIIGIGNLDDKLSQRRWSNYVFDINVAIQKSCNQVHFSGGSEYYQSWQNGCWVFEIEENKIPFLKAQIKSIRMLYDQIAVAWIEGITEEV